MKLVLDIGNSSLRIGVVDMKTLSVCRRVDMARETNFAPVVASVQALLQDFTEIQSIVIASVVHNYTHALRDVFRSILSQQLVVLSGNDEKPFITDYDEPASLGIDRVANICWCSAQQEPGRILVIDAGTAITIDVVDNRTHHRGGAIIPGAALMARTLHQQTDALPMVESLKELRPDYPGVSTLQNIGCGILAAQVGALEVLVKHWLPAGTGRVVATGGGWHLCAPHVSFACEHVPDLTLIGAALA